MSISIPEDLIPCCRKAGVIVIFGYAKTGKIKIARRLSELLDNRRVIVSDDYRNLGFEPALYAMIKDANELVSQGIPLIIEGVQTARMLRKGFKADLVIRTVCNWRTIRRCYIIDGEVNKLPKIPGFNKGLEKVFREYLRINKETPIYEFNTSIL